MATGELYTESRAIDKDSGLVIDYDVAIPIPATARAPAITLRANVFRPISALDSGLKLPAIMTLSPYGKDIHYRDFNAASYAAVPDEVKTEYMCWETLEVRHVFFRSPTTTSAADVYQSPQPTHWCAQGFVVIRVDERGFGHSPGFADIWSYTTGRDFAFAVEWASEQEWCNGSVGLAGVSYYAMNQWNAASHRPKGLKCKSLGCSQL